MQVFQGKYGLQFTTHIANHYTVPQLVELAELGRATGFRQIWVNDNLRYRNVFVVLSAMAARVDVDLGTAILVPYFRHPVDVADALVALSELRPRGEFSLGIARGDLGQVGQQLIAPKPVTLVRETVVLIRRLLDGDAVRYREFPTLVDYFHLNPEVGIRMAVEPRVPVSFFSGGNGPRIMRVAGEVMDGVLISGMYIPFVRSGRLASVLAPADEAGQAASPARTMRKVCELNVSLSPDREHALRFAKHYAAHAMLILDRMGFTREEYQRLGVDPSGMETLKRMFRQGATVEEIAEVVPDAFARACFVIGSADEVAEEIAELCAQAQAHGFEQVVFAKLGPDYAYSIRVLGERIMPSLA